jgi:curli biogenesis system outer membrane secretion channel CsgG
MILSGCSTASIDRGQAKAQTGAPDVAQVDVVSIPYDNAYPKYVVAVEPFTYAASGTVSGGRPGQHAGDFSRASVGPGLSAQLLTALSRSHNLQVVEVSALKKTADGGFGLKLEEGEIGPFILRGTVTEFNETADLSGGKKKVRLGPLGWIMGLVGAITDKDALTYAGAGVAAADVKYEKGNVKRQGMVGFDVRIINGANNRIVGAFNSSGTFVTMSATSGLSVFGIGKSNEEFAASALGQATRAAMNDAVKQTTDLLKAKHGSAATR